MMKRQVSLTVILLWGVCLADRPLPSPGALDAARPYEIVWAGRQVDEHAPAVVPFDAVDGWSASSAGGSASISGPQEHLIFWFLVRRKLRADEVVRFAKGGAFKGLTIRGGTNDFDCALHFSSLCAYRENLKPLSCRPRAKRGIIISDNLEKAIRKEFML